MPIQWYPGHMTKARRELADVMPSQDVIIEVLDARLPGASANPVVTELRADRPCLKVLSKSDLAEPAATAAWLQHLAVGPVLALAISADRAAETRSRITSLCSRLCPRPAGSGRPLRALVVGVPNVGKSTLINTLTGRTVAQVSDKPAVTRAQQLVVLKSGMILCDSPGLLWPKIEDEDSSLRLALAGSIPDTAIDYFNVASFAARLFLERFPDRLLARFKLPALPPSADALLDEIGRRRGCLRGGGVVDVHKAAEILVHEFRSGGLGRVTLETPPEPMPPGSHEDPSLVGLG